MKTMFMTLFAICVFSITASAGWIQTTGVACDPATSRPGTCYWVPDEPVNKNAVEHGKSETTWAAIKTFLYTQNPFIFYLK